MIKSAVFGKLEICLVFCLYIFYRIFLQAHFNEFEA